MHIIRLFSILCVICCLSGCGVSLNKLGISQHVWEQYTEQRQSEILANYAQIRSEKKAQKQAEKAISKNSWLEVGISGGSVMMPPFIFDNSYEPVSFKIYRNSCAGVSLKNPGLGNSIDLEACYKNNILFMDPSRYEPDKKDGSVRLYSSPLWRRGFTYRNINTSGYARLQKATVTVKSFNIMDNKL